MGIESCSNLIIFLTGRNGKSSFINLFPFSFSIFFSPWYDQQIGGEVLSVRLKTPAWRAEIERELQLCSANTGALFNAFTNSLLGDDFSIPSMEFDIGDEGQGTLLQSFFVVLFCLNQGSTNDMKMICFKNGCVCCAFLINQLRKWMWLSCIFKHQIQKMVASVLHLWGPHS